MTGVCDPPTSFESCFRSPHLCHPRNPAVCSSLLQEVLLLRTFQHCLQTAGSVGAGTGSFLCTAKSPLAGGDQRSRELFADAGPEFWSQEVSQAAGRKGAGSRQTLRHLGSNVSRRGITMLFMPMRCWLNVAPDPNNSGPVNTEPTAMKHRPLHARLCVPLSPLL